MEPNRIPPQDIAARQPTPGSAPQPANPRPVFSEFVARRPAAMPAPLASPTPQVTTSAAQPSVLQPVQNPQTVPTPSALNPPVSPLEPELIPDLPPTTHAKPAREHNPSRHTGLVGFGVFIVFTALFLAPFLPGKVLQNFPGSSQTFSTGDQNITCLGTIGAITTTLSYTTKNGFPIVYNYATTSKLSATCDGKPQSATGGHSSQFNPLGALIDVVAALAIAIIVAKGYSGLRRRGN